MKEFYLYLVCAGILIQPTNAFADSGDNDVFCQELKQIELEGIRMELAEGHLTKKEADYETSLILTTEQCICYFKKMIDGAGADYTAGLQKYLLATDKAIDLDEPVLPEGLDESKLNKGISTACGID